MPTTSSAYQDSRGKSKQSDETSAHKNIDTGLEIFSFKGMLALRRQNLRRHEITRVEMQEKLITASPEAHNKSFQAFTKFLPLSTIS